MIVADVNVLVYLLIEHAEFTPTARRVLELDSEWLVPSLWRHEFLNVLATSVRNQRLTEAEAFGLLSAAPGFVREVQTSANASNVLKLAAGTKIATYDCEYVLLARQRGLRLVTNDQPLIRAFADVAIDMRTFAWGSMA